MRCTVLLILIVVEIAYIIGGGFIFWALESEAEQQHKQQQRAFNLSDIIANLTASNSCVSDEDLQNFANQIVEAAKNGLTTLKESSDWDFHGSIFFAMTVVTTIGYGNVAPTTVGGQIFCCFFAIVGIPFTMVMLLGIGNLIKTLSKKMECHLCCRNRPRLNKFMNTVVITAVGAVFFLVIPAAIFTKLEGWGYGTSIYYGIITMGSIGFGDYVAAWSCVGDACWVYRISVGIWIYLGLAWLAGIIGTMQDALEGLISKTDPKPKKKPTEDETKPDMINKVAEKEVTESDDTRTLETIISVDPIDNEIQYESVRL